MHFIYQCSESSENFLMLGLLYPVFCKSTYNKYLIVLSSHIPLLDSFLVLQTAVRSPNELSQLLEDTLNIIYPHCNTTGSQQWLPQHQERTLFGSFFFVSLQFCCFATQYTFSCFQPIQVLNITFVNFIEAPYDAIHVGAAAHPIPDALIKQLKPGSRLFIPVGPTHGDQWLEQIDKDKDGNIVRQRLMGVRYVPLTDRAQQIWRN